MNVATRVDSAGVHADSSGLRTLPFVAGQGDTAAQGPNVTDTALRPTAAIPVAPAPEIKKKLGLIKRSYNGRQQVYLATGMMIFVIGMVTAAQQWNPR